MARKKKARPVAAFDLDGSLVREQLLVLLTKECFELDIFRTVAEVVFKEIRLQHRDRKITFEDYDRRIIGLFIERIKGKLRSDVEIAAKRVHDKHRDWLYVFSKTLLAELKPTHACITITGALSEVVEKLAPYWGFERFYATKLEVDGLGRYTGEHTELPVADKKKALLDHVAAHGGDLEGSVALGDTGSDIPLLSVVDLPIAFNPNDTLRTEAEARGWPIVLERKDSIYVLADGAVRSFRSSDADEAVRYLRKRRTRRGETR
jgi:HAD superfamily phosphoserine phosphatase-like hydrolase